VRIACHSHCPTPHLRSFLWDPDLSPRNNQLNSIKRAVKQNRLGLTFKDEVSPSATGFSEQDKQRFEMEISARLRREYAQEFRDHMAQLLKEQRLRISTSREEFRQEILDIKLDYEDRIKSLQEKLAETDQELKSQILSNADLRESEVSQLGRVEAIRDYYEQKLQNLENAHTSVDRQYLQNMETELRTKYDAESRELKATLQTREVELLYRNELEVQLHDEIARLREQNQQSLTHTGEQLLTRLVESGISLVSFQPGAGHLTIPITEVFKYLDDPTAYSAEKCSVSKERYVDWLTHYRMPVCQNILENEQVCGANIERIENPIDFKPGESNCCDNCRKKHARAHLRLA